MDVGHRFRFVLKNGRLAPESLADLFRIPWPTSFGFPGRHALDFAIGDLLEENQQVTIPLLENMLLDEDRDVRANAAWALGFVAEQISPAILLNLLENESDLQVRLAAIGSLSSFKGYPEVVEKLIHLLDDANEQVLIGAISSLGYLGDKRAIAPVKEILQKTANKRVREFVQSALKQLNS